MLQIKTVGSLSPFKLFQTCSKRSQALAFNDFSRSAKQNFCIQSSYHKTFIEYNQRNGLSTVSPKFASNQLLAYFCKFYSANALKKRKDDKEDVIGSVVESKDSEVDFSKLTTSQKVKQVGSDTFYTGIVVVGLALTGYVFYFLGMELFSTQTPNGLYNLAYKKSIKHDKVVSLLGSPLKAYGEMNRRGRRRHVKFSEQTQQDTGDKIMNIQFHLEGSVKKATVFAEAVAVAGGKYEIKHVVMRVDTYPHEVVTVLDER